MTDEMPPPVPDDGPTPVPGEETERQAAELAAMRRMLVASRETFSLSVAICNSPALRNYLVERLKTNSDGIKVLHLPDATEDVYETVREDTRDGQHSALFLVNLEKSLPSSADNHPVLQRLNATRELWKENCPCPVVLWLPEYAATLLSTHARDLWAWRSHQFEFVSEQAAATAALGDKFSGRIDVAANLNAEQKQFRIAELEQRIADAGDTPEAALAGHVLSWLHELAYLRWALGDTARAEVIQCKHLKLAQRLERKESVTSAYIALGMIYYTRGLFDDSETMLLRALTAQKKLRQTKSLASIYGNLGLIYHGRGDLEQAEAMLRKALEVEQRTGDADGMAILYGNLGLIFLERGELEEAERLHRLALDLDEKLGRLDLVASQAGNLAVIYMNRGDSDRAEALFRRTLKISEDLGLVEGLARTYANLAELMGKRGDAAAVRDYLAKSRDMFAQAGMGHRAEEMQRSLDRLPADEA